MKWTLKSKFVLWSEVMSGVVMTTRETKQQVTLARGGRHLLAWTLTTQTEENSEAFISAKLKQRIIWTIVTLEQLYGL